MPTADEQYAFGNPMLAQVEEPQTAEELAAQQLAYQLLVQQESAQPSRYPTAQLGNPMPEELPIAAQPPPADLSSRDSYIAAQLRFADMVRQRNEEQGGPNALQQPNAEELALKEQLSQAGNPLDQPPAPRMPATALQMPRTNADIARRNLAMAEQQEQQDLIRLNSSRTFKTQAELRNLVANVQQQQAAIRWRMIRQDNLNRGLDDRTSSANAWREVSPQVLASGSSGLFGAAIRASQPPPRAPSFVPANGGAPAYFRTGRDGSGVSQVRPDPSTVNAPTSFEKNVKAILAAEARAEDATARGDAKGATIARREVELMDRQLKAPLDEIKKQNIKWDDAEIKRLHTRISELTKNRNWAKNSGVEVTNLMNQVEVKRSNILNRLAPATVAPTTAPPPVAASAPVTEVTRLTKDGRKAIFDSATKKFIKYAE